MSRLPLPNNEVRFDVAVSRSLAIIVAGLRPVKMDRDVGNVADRSAWNRPSQDAGPRQPVLCKSYVVVRRFFRARVGSASVGRHGLFGHDTHDGAMNDGRAGFTVLSVDDDIALKTVLFVAVGAVGRVGCFGKSHDGIAGLVVHENQISRVNASDFTALFVNHGFRLHHDQRRHRARVNEHGTDQTSDHADGQCQFEHQRTQRVVVRHGLASTHRFTPRLSRNAFHCSRCPAPSASAASSPSAFCRRSSAVDWISLSSSSTAT